MGAPKNVGAGSGRESPRKGRRLRDVEEAATAVDERGALGMSRRHYTSGEDGVTPGLQALADLHLKAGGGALEQRGAVLAGRPLEVGELVGALAREHLRHVELVGR